MKIILVCAISLFSCQEAPEINIQPDSKSEYSNIELSQLDFLNNIERIVFRITLDGQHLILFDNVFLYKISIFPSLKLVKKVSVINNENKNYGIALSRSSIGLLLENEAECVFKEYDIELNEIGKTNISQKHSSFENNDVKSIKYYYKVNDTLIIERNNRINAIVIYNGINQYDIVNIKNGSYKTIDVVENIVYEIKPFFTEDKKLAYAIYNGSQLILNTITDPTDYNNLPSPILIYNNIVYYGGSGFYFDIKNKKWHKRNDNSLENGFSDHNRFNFGTYKLDKKTSQIIFKTES